MVDVYSLLMPLARRLPPETAHNLALALLRKRLLPACETLVSPSLRVNAFGLAFPNPVGLAAGFDKNAAACDALLAQGFGFVETGTVTPLPQPGNVKPRLFRLVEDDAIINRLGFNNEGLAPFVASLATKRSQGIVGANIGKNKDSGDAVSDYAQGMQAVYPYADYITVNISSPNTPGLRALQQRDALAELLAALDETGAACAKEHGKKRPLLIKIAPDLGRKEKEDIAELALTHDVSGLIVSNTTIARPPSLKSRHCGEQGGLSGKPLMMLSTDALREFYQLTGGKLTLIGAGGIASAEDAYAKIRAGATLVQLYTALAYQGFSLVRRINQGLTQIIKRDGFAAVGEAVGIDAR